MSDTGVHQIWVIDPKKVETQISSFSTNSTIEAMSPNGDIAFRNGSRIYLSRITDPGSGKRELLDIAPLDGRAVWVNGQWLVLLDRTVLKLGSGETKPQSIRLEPGELGLTVGENQKQPFKVIAIYADNREEEVTDKSTFRISDPAVATISSQGDIAAIAPGNTVVTAVYGNAEAQSLIKVAAIPEPSPLLTMESDKTTAGSTERVTVTLKAPQAADLYGFQLHLSFDAARLTFEKDNSALVTDFGSGYLEADELSPGEIQLTGTRTGAPDGISGPKGLVRLTFLVKGTSGQASVILRKGSLLADSQGKLTSLSSDTEWTLNIVNADVNGDGRIRLDDLILVGKAFGTHVGESGFNPLYDLTGDGVVNAADLEAVKSKMEPPF